MKILSKPKGNAEEYGRWSVNPYIGCPHGCLYCYLKSGPSGGYLGQPKAVLKKGIVSEDHAYHLAMAEILENREQIIRDGGLFMTFTSDPLAADTRDLMLRIVGSCIGYATTPKEQVIPVMLLTKNADFCGYNVGLFPTKTQLQGMHPWLSYFGLIRPDVLTDRLAIGWTLTGHDGLEPNASPNAERIAVMAWLSRAGYRTWASIEPVIDFDSSFRMIKQALDAGCEHFKIGLMTKNTKVCRHGFTLGGKTFEPYNVGQLITFVKNVMKLTDGRATVYWKLSVEDFLEGTDKKHPIRIYNRIQTMNEDATYGMTAREYLSQWPHSVQKDWSIFAPSPSVQ